MKILLFSLLATCALAQIISIDIGTASENVCSGSKWGSAQQASMGAQTIRYGPTVNCDIQVPNGTYSVTLRFRENRGATPEVDWLGRPIAAAGPGLRVFAATVNGVSTGSLDLFILAGPQKPYSAPPLTVQVIDGHLRSSFVASAGNASVSGIDRILIPPPPPPATALPKFVTETFPINSGTPVGDLGFIALTLLKTPVPDSGMFINFQSDNWWESVLQFIKPDISKTVNVIPPNFSGKLQIAYWSLD